jgi:hypothetical protein
MLIALRQCTHGYQFYTLPRLGDCQATSGREKAPGLFWPLTAAIRQKRQATTYRLSRKDETALPARRSSITRSIILENRAGGRKP